MMETARSEAGAGTASRTGRAGSRLRRLFRGARSLRGARDRWRGCDAVVPGLRACPDGCPRLRREGEACTRSSRASGLASDSGVTTSPGGGSFAAAGSSQTVARGQPARRVRDFRGFGGAARSDECADYPRLAAP